MTVAEQMNRDAAAIERESIKTHAPYAEYETIDKSKTKKISLRKTLNLIRKEIKKRPGTIQNAKKADLVMFGRTLGLNLECEEGQIKIRKSLNKAKSKRRGE